MESTSNGATGQARSTLGVAEGIRTAILDVAIQAYEDAGIQGLCAEGRWEAAVSAIRQLDLRAFARPVTKKTQSTDLTHPNRDAFPAGVAGPALRALEGADIRSMEDLERWTERDLGTLHGMGPKGLRMLREALHASGRDFRRE